MDKRDRVKVEEDRIKSFRARFIVLIGKFCVGLG